MEPTRASRGSWARLILTAVVAAITAILVVRIYSPQTTDHQNDARAKDTLSSVLKSGVIRCGYVIYPPGLTKDPNTGKIGGVFPEILEAAANNLDLKVEWVEEVGWGSMIEGLEANRYDMVCSPVWANAGRSKRADFTVALFYSGIGVYVREDDTRFTGSLAVLNDPSIKLAAIDGEMSDIIARQDFPDSTRVSLPQMSDVSQVLLNVTTGKADATFVEPYIAEQFLASNPGAVKNIVPLRPVRIFPNTMMVRQGEHDFRRMIDTALLELINAGDLEEALASYAPSLQAFYLTDYPYRAQ